MDSWINFFSCSLIITAIPYSLALPNITFVSCSASRTLWRASSLVTHLLLHHQSFIYNLHWLPVHHRVNFKIALLTYKILTFNQPSYLASLVNFNIAPRTLRSSDQHLLYLPRTCTVTGGRAFNLAAPKSMEFFTNLHSLLSFYRFVQTAPQNFLLLFSFSLTSSSHAGLPRASDSGPRP
jgi:hypothetical protein